MENDLISRKALCKAIHRYLLNLDKRGDLSGDGAAVIANVERIVREAPTIEAEPVRHGRWIKTRKHMWIKDEDGEVNEWAWDYEFHNGVSCEICHKSPCVHCEPDYDEKQDCREHYMCSECGKVILDLEPYCHCGAKMDAKEE